MNTQLYKSVINYLITCVHLIHLSTTTLQIAIIIHYLYLLSKVIKTIDNFSPKISKD